MQTNRHKATEPLSPNQKLAAAYYARQRQRQTRSFHPEHVDAIEAALGRPLDALERSALPRYATVGLRVSVEMINGSLRAWPIEIDIPMEQAARREALHRHGAAKVDRRGNVVGITPREAANELERLDHHTRRRRRRPSPGALRSKAPRTSSRQRQSHGASHGGSGQRGGDSGDDGSGPGSDSDGDGDAESAPTLVEAFRACTGRDPKAGRLCACGCGGSIDHLAKQARWLPSHQQRYNEERDRVGFGPIVGQPYEARNGIYAGAGAGDGGNLPALFESRPLESIGPVGDHDARAERRRVLAARALAETRHQLDAWRRGKGFGDAAPLVDTVPPKPEASPARSTSRRRRRRQATSGRARSWSGFVTEAVAA